MLVDHITFTCEKIVDHKTCMYFFFININVLFPNTLMRQVYDATNYVIDAGDI